MIIPVIFFITGFCHSQNEADFNKVQYAFGSNDITLIHQELYSIDTASISTYDKATWLYYFSDYQFKIDRHDIAYQQINESKRLFLDLNKTDDAIDCTILMLRILSHQNELKINTDEIIKETIQYATSKNDSIKLRQIYHRIASNYLDEEKPNQKLSIKYFKQIIPIALAKKDSIRVGYSFLNIGTAFQNTPPENIDSAIYYTRKAIKIIGKHEDYQNLAYAYNNYAQQLKHQRKYDSAKYYFSKADSIPLLNNIKKSKLIFYENIASIYDSVGDYKNLSLYLKKIKKLSDSINNAKQNIAIANIKEKYQVAEKEKEILETRNWLIALSAVITLILVIGYFSLKNSRRKRLLALQEKELETQKNLTLLKEQELNTINAMVEGQEKERKRVAEDLHDNLGSVIATLKLHFENLRINREKKKINQETLFDKTENLIDEAYQKVRSIAHAKNAGVIANQGLLVAVKLMAEKVSSANSIQIEVIDYGLEKPIENSLEIALFRIIQELTTNILKHAKATMATINISQDQDDITILIEDNGKGMDTSQINIQKGMGLHSIQTRVEHLDGSFTIDSTPTKGTTIIINIPI